MSPELERLIGKAVMDKDFRKKLMDDPDQALADAKISLDSDELEKVKKAITERGKDRAKADQALDAARGSTWN